MFTKDDILKEIRRTAKENDGVPLGRGRFESITGIKPYDWGRYWPRFGDAQKEAGYEANTLRSAFADDFLFEKFITLVRELGNFPVLGDIRVKQANTPGFPSYKTFYRKDTKQQLAAKLLKYSESKGYKDVMKICQEVLKELEKHEEQVEEKFADEKIGSVYLVKSGRYFKIGRTNEMGRRHHEITIQLPEGLVLIHEIKTDDPSGIEAYWHRRFESKHKNGEWFDLNSSDIRAFRRWRRIA